MKRIITYLLFFITVAFPGGTQPRVISDVKQKLSTLTLTVDSYKKALTALTPALSHEETKKQAEAWYLAGKINYGIYDKYIDTKKVGGKTDEVAMSNALIEGFKSFNQALSLDTIVELDKKGNPKIDKKTGKEKIKTKYSNEIVSKLQSHIDDYNIMAVELYNKSKWDNAYTLWDIYTKLIHFTEKHTGKQYADTIKGQTYYFQAISMWQKGDNAEAAALFQKARSLGYDKKETYDYALVCLSAINDDNQIVDLAKEAYTKFGVEDLQYVRILINDCINKNQFEKVDEYLNKAIEKNDSDAELQNLKGIVIEQRSSIEEALPFYKKCIELDPNNAVGQFNVGRYYYNMATSIQEKYPNLRGKKLSAKANPIYKEALPYLEKSYQLDKSNEEVANALKNIYYKLGEGKKLELLEKSK